MDHMSERSIGVVVGDLVREFQRFVGQTMDLAKAEMSAKGSRLAKDGVLMAAGGLISLIGLVFLLQAAAVGLTAFMPWWLSNLLVGGLVALVGLILLLSGYSQLKKMDMTPHETVESLKEDKEWAKKMTT